MLSREIRYDVSRPVVTHPIYDQNLKPFLRVIAG
jgi:hypothetical protein